jgi:hypothetical protein
MPSVARREHKRLDSEAGALVSLRRRELAPATQSSGLSYRFPFLPTGGAERTHAVPDGRRLCAPRACQAAGGGGARRGASRRQLVVAPCRGDGGTAWRRHAGFVVQFPNRA